VGGNNKTKQGKHIYYTRVTSQGRIDATKECNREKPICEYFLKLYLFCLTYKNISPISEKNATLFFSPTTNVYLQKPSKSLAESYQCHLVNKNSY